MSSGSSTVSAGPLYNSMWSSMAIAVAALAIGIGAGLLIGRATLPDPFTAAESTPLTAPAAGAPFVDYALRHAGEGTFGTGHAVASDRPIDYALRHPGAAAATAVGLDVDPLVDYALRHPAKVAPVQSDDYALRHPG